MYTVKDVAKMFQLTENTIRFYTDKGLLPTVTRDKNNIRQFDEDSLVWLTAIKCLRGCGMSVESIKEYVDLCLEGDSTNQQRYEIIRRQKELAEIEYKEAANRLNFITKKLAHYEDILNKQAIDDMNMANVQMPLDDCTDI